MNVWYVIPSARPVNEAMTCLMMWRGKGYKVAVLRDTDAEGLPVDVCLHGRYDGYAKTVNRLAEHVLRIDQEAEWIVTGGDDMLPDLTKDANEIGRQCATFFKGTLGVMQPTGDRFGEDATGKCAAERVCVSPWMGREWCQRSYDGIGPMFGDYWHFFVDEDLHCVAEQHGLLWHRRDINQHHAHWSRDGLGRPDFLTKAQSEWAAAKQLFEQRKAAGFPFSGIK